MTDSILDSVKEALGVPVADTSYDSELIMFTNSALSTLSQVGVGPDSGYAIKNRENVWDELLSPDLLGPNPRLNNAQTYVFLKVKLVFDPPTTSFLLDAYKEQIREAEWRLNETREETKWVSPYPVLAPEQEPLF